MRTIPASDALLRWSCWALLILVIASALLSIGISQGILVKAVAVPDGTDFVDRLLAYRASDAEANALYLVNNLITAGIFVLAVLVGTLLRRHAAAGSTGDVMAALFVIGGVIGILGALVNIGVNQVATFGYCDCGYRAEEVIAQDYALVVGWTVQTWLSVGGLLIVGVGVAVAGKIIRVSEAWTWISYAIAAALAVASVLQVLDQRQLAQLITSLTAGIGVTIWALLLARATRPTEAAPAPAAA